MVVDLLQEYRTERDALLQRAVELLEQDERVVAAWLQGSMGRGDHDDLSDIDLWAVVADEHMEAVGAERREYAARVGDPLLIVEAPQNAPPGGAYLLVQYPGKHGPVTLDLSWQPRSQARVSVNVRMLFDREGLPPAEPPELRTQEEHARLVRTEANFFWAMCPIAAKYIARRSAWEALSMLRMLTGTLNQAKWYAGLSSTEPGYRNIPTVPPPVQPTEQLAQLRQMATDMESLMQQASLLHNSVSSGAIEQVYSYFDFVWALVIEDTSHGVDERSGAN